MNFLKSKLILSTLLATAALTTTASYAAQDPSKSADVRGALISNCKEGVSKAGKLTAAETDKFCTCNIDTEGRLTKAQEWQLVSAINQKKSPSSLPFIQQQNKTLQACFGPQLTAKLKGLAEEAMKSAPPAQN